MSDTRPLAGLRVLDMTRLLPGPYLSLVLADLGADVVKVEAPNGGDWVRYVPPMHGGLSAQFIALNRGKRSLTLNLKKAGGTDVLRHLVRSADVLLESFRPGVLNRLGVGWEVLRKENPRLIYAAITGYGQTGPYQHRAGHDLNYMALSGSLAMTGPRGGAPQMAGVQVADIGGGALFGAVGILAALRARDKTGEGRFVDVSLTEGASAFNVLAMATALCDGGQQHTRGTDQLGGAAACYGVYETSDNHFITVAALEPKFWASFCEAVERPDWSRRHLGDDAAMKVEIASLIATRTRTEWETLFSSFDACCEPVLEVSELEGHPQHQARELFFDLQQTSEGPPIRQVRNPLLSPEEVTLVGPAPKLGEHTRAILGEAGYPTDEIEDLVARGVVTAL